MKFSDKIDHANIDVDSVITLIKCYSKATGVNVNLIDTSAKLIYSTCSDGMKCEFCTKAEQLCEYAVECEKVHLYGTYQAERFGGRYIFFCPSGLVHFVSPIVINGFVEASLVGGPVLMVNKDEFLAEEIMLKHNTNQKNAEFLEPYLDTLQYISPEKVRSLSEMLFVTAAYLSKESKDFFTENQEFLQMQSDVSEYVHYIKTFDNGEGENKYPIDKERELLEAITSGDKHLAQQLLNEILGYIFFSSGRVFDIIKARILELVVLLSRAALEGGADIELIFGMNYKYLNEIHNFKNVDELAFWLSKIMVRFTDCVFNLVDVKHVDVIYKAIEYIKQNYMQKLTLEDVAAHVYLSPSYFSKIFKDEMSSNFNTYLNSIRIENSKKLLLKDNVSLIDISNMVGYEDQSYFSKVFKKMTGITPGKFRETRGKGSARFN